MKKVLKTVLFWLFILFLLLSTVILTYQYFHSYQWMHAQKAEMTVAHKLMHQNDFLPHAYYVLVDEQDEEISSIYDTKRHYISKMQWQRLDAGDKVSGFTTDGQNFYTVLDFFRNSIVFFIVLVIFIGLLAILLYPSMLRMRWIGTYLEKVSETLQRYIPRHLRWKQAVLGACSLLLSVFSILFLLHIFHQVIPLHQTKTEAKVIEKNVDRSSGPYLRMHHYYLTVEYDAENGEQIAIIDVPMRAYQASVEETISISYRNANTYDAFYASPPLKRLMDVVLSVKMVLFGLMLYILYWFVKLYIKERNSHQKKKA